MHRPTVGMISLAALAGWLALWIHPLEWDGSNALHGACLRVGVVMAAIWLALPQLRRVPGWIIEAVAVTGLVIAVRPRVALFVLPLLAVYLILRPKAASRPTRK